MTDQSDILTGGEVAPQPTTPAAAQAPAPTVDPLAAKLASIRNDEGLQKYASVDDALTGAIHAQEFIQTLKQEKQQLLNEREEDRVSYENALSQIASAQQADVTAPATESGEDFYSKMESYEKAKAYQSNRKSVVDTLVNYCNGDQVKAAELISSKLTEIGMGREELQMLSERSPAAVSKLFGLDGMGTTSSKFEGTINTDAMGTHVKQEVSKPKALPIGASSSHLVDAWRDAGAALNNQS
jgi:hypothetical protein